MVSPHLHKHVFALIVLVFLLVLATVFSIPPSPPVEASNPPAVDELKGWAWASNTGYISFNCGQDGACASSNYKVSVNPTNGLLSGYAWSAYVGWISFNSSAPNDLTGCPEAPCEARLSTTVINGKRQLTGWARVISYPAGDGFISLSPHTGDAASAYDAFANCAVASPPPGCYGPRMDTTTGKFSGSAWGGGSVVGWIDFGSITSGGSTNDSVALVLPSIPNAVISSFTATPGSLFIGENTSVAWTTQNVTTCSASASDTSSSWDSADATVNAATSTGSLLVPVNQNTTYTLTCNPGSVSAQASVTATEPPPDVSTFDMTATPPTVAVSFVSNKKETTTQTMIRVQPEGGFNKLVTLTIIPNPDPGAEATAIGQVNPKARWRTRDTGPLNSDTLSAAEYNADTGRELYIEFQQNAQTTKYAPAAGDYHFIVRGVATGGGTVDIPLTVRVQSFIPSFEEQ